MWKAASFLIKPQINGCNTELPMMHTQVVSEIADQPCFQFKDLLWRLKTLLSSFILQYWSKPTCHHDHLWHRGHIPCLSANLRFPPISCNSPFITTCTLPPREMQVWAVIKNQFISVNSCFLMIWITYSFLISNSI